MEITLNGEDRDVADGATVAALLGEVGLKPDGVAVAVEAAVVPQSTWETTIIRPGATVEILTAVQGG